MSLASRGLIKVVRYYQREISPRKPVPTCRFTPTCSEYAAQAIARHGALKGGWLATWRVVRCNPLVPGGFDPVPDQFPSPRVPRSHTPRVAQDAASNSAASNSAVPSSSASQQHVTQPQVAQHKAPPQGHKRNP